MEFTTQVNVSAEKFFAVVLETVIVAVDPEGKGFDTKKLRKGYRYKHILTTGKEATCTIKEYKENQNILIEYKMDRGTSETGYMITPIDDQNCSVIAINRYYYPGSTKESELSGFNRWRTEQNLKKKIKTIVKFAKNR